MSVIDFNTGKVVKTPGDEQRRQAQLTYQASVEIILRLKQLHEETGGEDWTVAGAISGALTGCCVGLMSDKLTLPPNKEAFVEVCRQMALREIRGILKRRQQKGKDRG